MTDDKIARTLKPKDPGVSDATCECPREAKRGERCTRLWVRCNLGERTRLQPYLDWKRSQEHAQ